MMRQNKYCPHCHACYERGSRGGQRYGAPLRVCGSCGNRFVDNSYIEPFFEQTPKKITLGKAFLVCLWPVGVIAIVAVMMVLRMNYDRGGLIAAIPVCLYVVFSFLIYLRGDKIYEKQRQQCKESFDRLQDQNYVILLLDHDCYVPHDFLLRVHPNLLHYTPKGHSIPQNKGNSYMT